MHMFWQDHGGTGPCLLMVHGFLSSAAQWIDNVPALRQHCRPITVDLWGHGRSPTPKAPEQYQPSHWVAQFDAIRQTLGVEKWFLLGYSLGAGATIRYALTHPERTLGHIFTNSASGFADAEQARAIARDAETSAEKLIRGGRSALERIPVHPLHARRLPTHIYDALVADTQSLDPLAVANIIRFATPALSVRDAVAGNRVPALLVCGAKENRFLPHRDYAASHMPNLTIANLETGHGVNMQDPDNFNRLVIEFIERWQAPASAA